MNYYRIIAASPCQIGRALPDVRHRIAAKMHKHAEMIYLSLFSFEKAVAKKKGLKPEENNKRKEEKAGEEGRNKGGIEEVQTDEATSEKS